jgi:hypothetical protein
MSKKTIFCFGSGFRKFESVRSDNDFPSQRPEVIAPEIDPIETFRFEKVDCSADNVSYRIRSDVSMLLHAAESEIDAYMSDSDPRHLPYDDSKYQIAPMRAGIIAIS